MRVPLNMASLASGILPFKFADFLRLILVILFPLIALWLRNSM